ncbi:Swi5-domain-containing protein [Cryomyces antarcticus]
MASPEATGDRADSDRIAERAAPTYTAPATATATASKLPSIPRTHIDGNTSPPSTPLPLPSARDKRLLTLQTRLTTLRTTHSTLTAQRDALISSIPTTPTATPSAASAPTTTTNNIPKTTDDATTAALHTAAAIVKRHIKLLHDYNEIKDIGMGLLGLITDQRGVRIREVQKEFGLEGGD